MGPKFSRLNVDMAQLNTDLDHSSRQRSELLIQKIQQEITHAQGSISFSKFMELCLYTPKLGYYSGDSIKFGAAGDFQTAPLISPLFSQCLATQCQQILKNLGNRSDFLDILELGAGTGQMALDILIELNQQGNLPQHYFILEISEELRLRQQELFLKNIPDILQRIIWISDLDELKNFRGIILANEFLDALPFNYYCIHGKTLHEGFVSYESENFHFKFRPTNEPQIQQLYQNLISENSLVEEDTLSGYFFEYNINLKNWIDKLSTFLTQGVILFIDYGFPRHEFYHRERRMGTLMCHFRHLNHANPFVFLGLQDITAHIDFTQVAEFSHQANLDLLGYTNQASFLMNCGLMDFANKALSEIQTSNNSNNPNVVLSHAINLLTSPAEMGELFKVLALGKNWDQELIGFASYDYRYKL